MIYVDANIYNFIQSMPIRNSIIRFFVFTLLFGIVAHIVIPHIHHSDKLCSLYYTMCCGFGDCCNDEPVDLTTELASDEEQFNAPKPIKMVALFAGTFVVDIVIFVKLNKLHIVSCLGNIRDSISSSGLFRAPPRAYNVWCA